ncbi:hypothetical protein MIR68_002017 [Amoeboaphelidium protococcarum]|nr:hypothetical protein MIR68_002017 [Amoeboaphelidium protococcarum]
MVMIHFTSKFVCNIIAFLYPAYASYKALRSRDLKQMVPWLMYWIVIAIFSTIELITDIFVFWLPFYYSIKLIFILWLILPFTKGHIYLYRFYIHPTLKKHEPHIDRALQDVQTKAYKTSQTLSQKGFEILRQSLLGSVLTLNRSRSLSAPTPVEEVTYNKNPGNVDNNDSDQHWNPFSSGHHSSFANDMKVDHNEKQFKDYSSKANVDQPELYQRKKSGSLRAFNGIKGPDKPATQDKSRMHQQKKNYHSDTDVMAEDLMNQITAKDYIPGRQKL